MSSKKLNFHKAKSKSIKQAINIETGKVIKILKINEKIYKTEIEANLNSSKYEDNVLFQIDKSKENIEKIA